MLTLCHASHASDRSAISDCPINNLQRSNQQSSTDLSAIFNGTLGNLQRSAQQYPTVSSAISNLQLRNLHWSAQQSLTVSLAISNGPVSISIIFPSPHNFYSCLFILCVTSHLYFLPQSIMFNFFISTWITSSNVIIFHWEAPQNLQLLHILDNQWKDSNLHKFHQSQHQLLQIEKCENLHRSDFQNLLMWPNLLILLYIFCPEIS